MKLNPSKAVLALALTAFITVGLSSQLALAQTVLTPSQSAIIQVSAYLQKNAEPGSIVSISYRLSKVDPNLVGSFMQFDLSPELKADIDAFKIALVSAKEQALNRNVMLALQVSQVGQQAAMALVKNGAQIQQIESDLEFLESVENLNGVDHSTRQLTPAVIERLSTIEVSEKVVIEGGPSIVAVLARVQELERSQNKNVSNVSLLPFKAPIYEEPTPIGFHSPTLPKPRIACESAFSLTNLPTRQ